jgi:hypothetical protein
MAGCPFKIDQLMDLTIKDRMAFAVRIARTRRAMKTNNNPKNISLLPGVYEARGVPLNIVRDFD